MSHGLVYGDPMQLFPVCPGLQTRADLLQAGVEGPGEAGSGSAAISMESVRLKVGRHCLLRWRSLALFFSLWSVNPDE